MNRLNPRLLNLALIMYIILEIAVIVYFVEIEIQHVN